MSTERTVAPHLRRDGWVAPVWSRALAGPEGVLTLLLVVLLAALPLGDAGRSAWTWSVNAMAFGILVLARELLSLRSGAAPGVPLKRFVPAAVPFVLVIGFCVLQTVPLPTSLGHPVWSVAGDALGTQRGARLSIDPDATSLATLRLMTAACAFWIAAHLSADPARALLILGVVVAIGAAVTVWGLWTAASGEPLRGSGSVALIDVVAERFGNRNVYASYAGMVSVVALALTWRRLQKPFERGAEAPGLMILGLLRACSGVGMVLIAAYGVLVTAVVASGSRGAILSTALATAVLAALMLAPRHRGERRRALLHVLVSIAGFVAALLAFGDVALSRLGRIGLSDPSRVAVAETTVAAILASPWFGTGYGTFPALFPMFRDDPATIWNSWSSAHNVYLETAAELGLPVAVLLMASVGAVVWSCLKGAPSRKRYRAIPAAGASAAVLAFVHASVDFSLSVQAVNLTLATILGVGFAQAVRRDEVRA